jgi:hypothetical protein
MLDLFRMPRSIAAALAGAVLLAVVAADADAGFTSVRQSRRPSEVSHEQILEHVYGGNFVADPTGLSFSNESGVTVTRLEDDGPGADQLWAGRVVSAKAVASFGRKARTASYFGGTSGGQFTRLFETTGNRFDVSGAAGDETTLDGGLTAGRGRKAARVFSSVAAANRDGMDHLVSYEVRNAGAAGEAGQAASTYLLCWEDKFARRSDRDYNDMVVEVKTAGGAASGAAATAAALTEPLLIPLPAGLWSGLGGLLGLGAIRVIRNAARHARL